MEYDKKLMAALKRRRRQLLKLDQWTKQWFNSLTKAEQQTLLARLKVLDQEVEASVPAPDPEPFPVVPLGWLQAQCVKFGGVFKEANLPQYLANSA